MMEEMPFGNDPDRELGSLIREAYADPDPEQFLARLRGSLEGLPPRVSQWDVLATWARPGVVAAAAAAAFLLGVALWQTWWQRVADPVLSVPSVSVAMLDATQARQGSDPILYAVLEGQ